MSRMDDLAVTDSDTKAFGKFLIFIAGEQTTDPIMYTIIMTGDYFLSSWSSVIKLRV